MGWIGLESSSSMTSLEKDVAVSCRRGGALCAGVCRSSKDWLAKAGALVGGLAKLEGEDVGRADGSGKDVADEDAGADDRFGVDMPDLEYAYGEGPRVISGITGVSSFGILLLPRSRFSSSLVGGVGTSVWLIHSLELVVNVPSRAGFTGWTSIMIGSWSREPLNVTSSALE